MIYVLLTYLLLPLLSLAAASKKRRSLSRVLVIQTAKIGDLICSTPLFREIKKVYPTSHLSVMVNPVTRELLEDNPHVDEVIEIRTGDYSGLRGRWRLSRLIARGDYDAALCLNPSVPYAVSLLWGLVPRRISVMPDYSGRTFRLAAGFFTGLERHVRGRLVIETYLRALRSLGVQSTDITKEVYKSASADAKADDLLQGVSKPLIGIALSSGNKLKELGCGRIASLARVLIETTGGHIVLIGSGDDKRSAEKVIETSRNRDRIVDATGKLSLRELPALVERLALFIGVDTGITYMADALSIPVIDIAGPSDMEDQRPTGQKSRILQKRLPCVPCSHSFKAPYFCKINTRACIESVDVEEIASAAKSLIAV